MENNDGMTLGTLDASVGLAAEFAALQELAARHRREFMRLRTVALSRLTGQPVRFTRERWSPEQLAQLPDVTDSTGVVLERGARVRCPDGVRAVVRRVDRRSRRCVVERADGTTKMTVAAKLTVQQLRKAADAPTAAAAVAVA